MKNSKRNNILFLNRRRRSQSLSSNFSRRPSFTVHDHYWYNNTFTIYTTLHCPVPFHFSFSIPGPFYIFAYAPHVLLFVLRLNFTTSYATAPACNIIIVAEPHHITRTLAAYCCEIGKVCVFFYIYIIYNIIIISYNIIEPANITSAS